MLGSSKIRNIVIEQLEKVGAKAFGDEMRILCPFHDDSTPSLNVHIGHKITPGSFNCFACKAHGGWNRLAKALKLQFIDFEEDPLAAALDSDNPFKDLLEDFKHINKEDDKRILLGMENLSLDFNWRGVPYSIYKILGGRYYWDRKQDQEYLYFDLMMNGQYMGYTLCAIDPQAGITKYQIFAEAKKVLFLYDLLPMGETIVLVEGHFDAIRLFSEGFFTVGIFGTQNWSPIKSSLIAAKEPKKVVIVFDGDQAGYDASVKIYNDLAPGMDTDILYLPPNENLDPGNMSEMYLNKLRRMADA